MQREMPVIPVLVHDAVMPTADELPDTIKGFAYHNATPRSTPAAISTPTWTASSGPSMKF